MKILTPDDVHRGRVERDWLDRPVAIHRVREAGVVKDGDIFAASRTIRAHYEALLDSNPPDLWVTPIEVTSREWEQNHRYEVAHFTFWFATPQADLYLPLLNCFAPHVPARPTLRFVWSMFRRWISTVGRPA
jgi:hypothetical protein